MTKLILATLAILALTLGGSTSINAASYQQGTSILVTRTTNCGIVEITATGYALAVDSAFQLVAGKATKLVFVEMSPTGMRSITAQFSREEIGENGSAVVRTRYGGYVEAWAQVSPGAAFTPAELIAWRTC